MWQPSDNVIDSTDAAVQSWQQGDVYQQGDTAWVALRDQPLTEATEALGGTGLGVTQARDDYLVVVSQTCDIIRDCWEPPDNSGGRPFILVCPVVTLDGEELTCAKKGWIPRYAYLPGLGSNCFANLDRCSAVEKTILIAASGQLDGCGSNDERRRFAEAVGEYFSRFAFPDGMEKAVNKMRSRFREKHDGGGKEGALMRDVNQVRVCPVSTWDVETIEVELTFIVEPLSLPRLDPCAEPPVLDPDLLNWADNDPSINDVVERLTNTGTPEERNYLWQMLAQRWARLADNSGKVRIVGAEAVSASEYSFQRMRQEPKLSFDHISLDTPTRAKQSSAN